MLFSLRSILSTEVLSADSVIGKNIISPMRFAYQNLPCRVVLLKGSKSLNNRELEMNELYEISKMKGHVFKC